LSIQFLNIFSCSTCAGSLRLHSADSRRQPRPPRMQRHALCIRQHTVRAHRAPRQSLGRTLRMHMNLLCCLSAHCHTGAPRCGGSHKLRNRAYDTCSTRNISNFPEHYCPIDHLCRRGAAARQRRTGRTVTGRD
jgi:hypothetical protein